MFSTNELVKKGYARLSQTLNGIPGRQYNCLLRPGNLRIQRGSRSQAEERCAVASAHPNAVQVSQRLYPCSTRDQISPPGSRHLVGNRLTCKTFHHEQVKTIVSSPTVETTLMISFDCDAISVPLERNNRRHYLDIA